MTDTTLQQIEWIEITESFDLIHANLAAFFEDMEDEEDITDDFKDGLRFATYLKIVLGLRAYPAEIELAIDKAKELVLIFNDAEFQFSQEQLDELRIKIMDLEEYFWGEGGVDVMAFMAAATSDGDPAHEDDEHWILDLFDTE